MPFSTPAAAVLLVAIPTYFLYRRRPVAAGYFALLFAGDRLWILPWLYVFSTRFIVVWFGLSLAWGFFFVQALRGTAAIDRQHHRS